MNLGASAGRAGLRAGAAYTASKHGLLGLTKNIAAFYGKKGIRCNAIMPGGMRTNIGDAFVNGINVEGQAIVRKTMTNEVPLCDPKKIAATVLFLCSDAASDLNGACVPVDNGWTATWNLKAFSERITQSLATIHHFVPTADNVSQDFGEVGAPSPNDPTS